MANTTNTKSPTATITTINNSHTLTVVVVDAKGQPTTDARVYIKPSDASGVTNDAGEIQFTLGSDTKYNITATADGKTVTVPYYVTKNGATRLVINPVYVKNIEEQLHPGLKFSSGVVPIIGIGLLIFIVFFIVWKLVLHRKFF